MQQDTPPEHSAPPKRGRWFYGWTVVGAVSIVPFAGGVETNPVLGVFQDPITEDLGWSRAAFTLPMAIGTFAGGIAAVVLGPLMDRYGARWIMAAAVIVMGLIFIGIGFGTIMGAGLYFLIIRPALVERKASEKDKDV